MKNLVDMEIKTIIFGRFNGNCYLLRTDKGFVLIDTGLKSKRRKVEEELISQGCKPGNLDLIIVTHGDFDHTGNCAYLREKYGTKIAMHKNDAGMVEKGDMFWNRQKGNKIIKILINVFFKISKFKPDFYIDENSNLSTFGLNAKILYLPGHTKGSIGVLTYDKNFFCGDLFINQRTPKPNTLVDNIDEFKESVNKVKSLDINKVYPGHGQPFQMSFLS